MIDTEQITSQTVVDIPEATGHTYVHGDGRVEQAANFEQAIKVCKGLGSMSVEEAKLTWELNALGQELMNEAKTQTPAEALPTDNIKPEAAADTAGQQSLDTKSTLHKNNLSKQDRSSENELHARKQVEETLQILDAVKSNGLDTKSATEPAKDTSVTVIKDISEAKISPANSPKTIEVKDGPEAVNEQPVENHERDSLDKIASSAAAESQELPSTESKVKPLEISLPSKEVAIDSSEPEQSEPVALTLSGGETPTLESDVMEIFWDLRTLSAIEQLDLDLLTMGSIDNEELAVDWSEDMQDFEAYLMAQPTSQETVSIETIQQNGGKQQPLEQAFVQLAEYLSSDDETEIKQEIKDILEDISTLLTGIENGKVTISPELTVKLLTLLEFLGYEDPNDVLISFVSNHSVSFLLQAIKYLNGLSNGANNQEFTSSFSSTKVSYFKLGKVLTFLITRLQPALNQLS